MGTRNAEERKLKTANRKRNTKSDSTWLLRLGFLALFGLLKARTFGLWPLPKLIGDLILVRL